MTLKPEACQLGSLVALKGEAKGLSICGPHNQVTGYVKEYKGLSIFHAGQEESEKQ